MPTKRTSAAKAKAESSDAPASSVAVELNPKTTFYDQKVMSMTKDDFLALFSFSTIRALYDPLALAGYLAYILWLVVFTLTLKGDKYPGVKLRNGQYLKYECNGFSVLLSLLSIAIYCASKGPGIAPALWVYEHWVGINVAAILVAFAVSIWVYLNSFEPGALLALGGNTGNTIYDFMIGRELNPRVGDLDIKFFVELRPPLMGWLLTNICMAITQYNDLGRITNSMVLVIVFEAWYVIDAIWNEPLVLTTMDITNDGFGFMLAFGNLCWVPMVYGLQARYLVDFPLDLTTVQVVLIIALQLTGFYIFRSANSLKNQFRTNPNDPALKDITYIETKAGTRLMTNSWWGYSRHINYFGDLLMALSWCLPTGFSSPIPYFYFFYFAFLLWHRQGRDEHKCRQKYGDDWTKYCKLVPYKIIPGLYYTFTMSNSNFRHIH
ncbi:unnamed protein product [Umbelopsis ramanniana]